MRIRATLLVLLTAAALPLVAHPYYSDFYVIPAAGHVSGLFGATWQSDVVIHNFQSTPIAVEMALVESGVRTFGNVQPIQVGGSSTITIAPGATLSVADVLKDHRGQAQAMGAILIGADKPFAVVSRSFAVSPSGTTVGQTVDPVSDFLDNVGAVGSGVALVPGIAANARFRTNLGFLAAASPDATFVVEVSLVGRTGAAIGTTRTFAIPSGAMAHLVFSSRELAGAFDEAVARFRILSGSGAIAPYASVIENSSNNAMFLNGGFPPGTSTTSGSASYFREVLRSVNDGSPLRARPR